MNNQDFTPPPGGWYQPRPSSALQWPGPSTHSDHVHRVQQSTGGPYGSHIPSFRAQQPQYYQVPSAYRPQLSGYRPHSTLPDFQPHYFPDQPQNLRNQLYFAAHQPYHSAYQPPGFQQARGEAQHHLQLHQPQPLSSPQIQPQEMVTKNVPNAVKRKAPAASLPKEPPELKELPKTKQPAKYKEPTKQAKATGQSLKSPANKSDSGAPKKRVTAARPQAQKRRRNVKVLTAQQVADEIYTHLSADQQASWHDYVSLKELAETKPKTDEHAEVIHDAKKRLKERDRVFEENVLERHSDELKKLKLIQEVYNEVLKRWSDQVKNEALTDEERQMWATALENWKAKARLMEINGPAEGMIGLAAQVEAKLGQSIQWADEDSEAPAGLVRERMDQTQDA